MTTTERKTIEQRIEFLRGQARNIQDAAYWAAEMKSGGVCMLNAEMDECIFEYRRLEASLR